MKESFRSIRFSPDRLKLIRQCNAIIDDFARQGQPELTLRQVYYQLVQANVIANTKRVYKNLGALISDARLAGLIDWDVIEDRTRVPKRPNEFNSLSDLMDAALSSYRLPRWRKQPVYVELWAEKDAITNILGPIAREYHVTMMVNRGYLSSSAAYVAAARFGAHQHMPEPPGQASLDIEDVPRRELVLLYLGDHDPSGEDMVRDIRERLSLFGVEVDVRKIGLTIAQVRQYKLPPNPAKVTDSRSKEYIKKFGRSSWEVDALSPTVLTKIIRAAIEDVLDQDLMNTVIAEENVHKAALEKVVAQFQDKNKPKPRKGRR